MALGVFLVSLLNPPIVLLLFYNYQINLDVCSLFSAIQVASFIFGCD